MNVNLTINGTPVTVPKGTTILEAARQANIKIPTLCDHPDLCRRAVCRICVVESDRQSKLIAACANDVWEGANILTHSARIMETRKTILELLLANHPQDCLYCVKNKNCELQTLAETFGIRSSPFGTRSPPSTNPPASSPLASSPSAKPTGTLPQTGLPPQAANHKTTAAPTDTSIIMDMDKCVKCGRCLEMCQTVKGLWAINTFGRGKGYGICTPYGQPLEEGPCDFCGKCALVCPVAAIHKLI